MLLGLGLLGEAARLAERVVDAEIEIGATTIAVAGILAGLAVLLGMCVLVKILRLLLEVEVLRALALREGIPRGVRGDPLRPRLRRRRWPWRRWGSTSPR